MAHLTVYPHDLTPAQWVTAQYASGLGRLPDALEPRTHLVINGDWSLSLRYPVNGTGAELLQAGRLICAEGQLYRIQKKKKSDKSAGREMQIDALHIIYDLRRKTITNIETSETDPDGIGQAAALALILNGTPFFVGTVDNTTTLEYLDLLQKSAFWALKEQVLALWGGELCPDNWTVNILAQVGQDRRYPIRRGRNIAGIEYTESIEDTITRLHVVGYGGATFESINGGLDYIDSPNIGKYHTPYEGDVEFPDDDLPADLMAKALAHLPTVDVPKASYAVDLLKLQNSEQYKLYKPLQTFGLGDSAVIHHEFFDVDILARAMDLQRDPVLGETVAVTLGNYQKDLYRALSDATKSADLVDKIISRGGNLRGEKLRGTIDLLTTLLKMSGSYASASVLEGQGFLTENNNEASPDYGATYIGCGIWALANEKNPDNSWKWSTFGTPRGFAGEWLMAASVTANKLASDVAESLELTSNVSVKNVVQAAVNAEYGQLQDYAKTLLTDHDWTVEIGDAQQAAVELAGGELDTFAQWVRGWMTFDGNTLSLGKSDNLFKTEITNTRLAFTYNGTTLAYFAGDRLVVPWAEFEKVTMMARNTAGTPSSYLDITFDGVSYSGTLRG